MRNLRALLSYDGSKFFGWQRQEGFWSVQEALERAIEAVSGEAVTVHGAGRTDTALVTDCPKDTWVRTDRRRLLPPRTPGSHPLKIIHTSHLPSDFSYQIDVNRVQNQCSGS